MKSNQTKEKGLRKSLFRSNGGTTLSLIIVYIGICIILSFLSPYFFTPQNFLNIGIYCSIIGVMGAGVTVAMLLGAIDISQYAVASLSGITAAMMLGAGMNVGVVVVCCLLVGLLCGLVNGTLVAIFGVSAMITTLATMQIFRGVAYVITDANTIMVDNAGFSLIGKGYILNTVPIPILIMVFVFVLTYYILNHTGFGRSVFAVGGNENASYLSGINIKSVQYGGIIISSVFASLAGLIIVSQVGAAVPSNGVGSEMGILSGVILGGISLSGGKGSISGTIIGVLILATIQNGLTLLSVKTFYQMIINGIVLLAAVLLDVARRRMAEKRM